MCIFLERDFVVRVASLPVLCSNGATSCLLMICHCGLSAGSEPPLAAIRHGIWQLHFLVARGYFALSARRGGDLGCGILDCGSVLVCPA